MRGTRYDRTMRIAEHKWHISGAEQDRVFKNLAAYLNEVRMESMGGEGKRPEGLLLTKVPPTSYAYERGLRSGDIITMVNTFKIEVVEQIWILKDHLRRANAIRVHYTRNGKQYRKFFKLRR